MVGTRATKARRTAVLTEFGLGGRERSLYHGRRWSFRAARKLLSGNEYGLFGTHTS
jgi:hypothetical protein